VFAAASDTGTVALSTPDSVRTGHAMLQTSWAPRLVGVEMSDTASATLARSRAALPAAVEGRASQLSDLLLYRSADDPATSLDSALARAIPGDTVYRQRPVALYWESYAPDSAGETAMALTVERIDRGWLHSTRQRLGMEDADSPLRMRWADTRAGSTGSGRSLSLDLNKLPAGRYRITLGMTPPEGVPRQTSREITLLER
jgi:hypothetical protein